MYKLKRTIQQKLIIIACIFLISLVAFQEVVKYSHSIEYFSTQVIVNGSLDRINEILVNSFAYLADENDIN